MADLGRAVGAGGARREGVRIRPVLEVMGARLGESPPVVGRAVIVVAVVVDEGTGTLENLLLLVILLPAVVVVEEVAEGGLFSFSPPLSFVGEPLDAGRGLNTLTPLR